MYRLQLSDSLVPAQADADVLEITVGGLFREVAAVWCRLDAFPLTGSRKIQKLKLRDAYLGGDDVDTGRS